MTKERLRSSDYRFIAACLAMLAATAWYSVRNFHRAFPEASIDFRVNRGDARNLAERFLAAQGLRTEGYREASRFDYDDRAKTFLEREAGLEQANRLMGSRVRLWRWAYRWFRPGQKEEYRVEITPAGGLAGFSHLLPEDAARPAATAGEARALAEAFLRERMRRDPASLEFVEASENTLPHRIDRVFAWKEKDFNLRDAAIRVEVGVQGNQVSDYREYLKIPERWTRDYQRLRSKNEMATYVDLAFMMALVVGLVVVIVAKVRGRQVRWRLAAAVGAVAVALSFLASLNQFGASEFSYPTTDSYPSFVSTQLLQALLSALAYGGILFVITAGAEPLYRAAFPGGISIGNLFRPQGLRTKRFFLGAILGISLTGAFIAYQTAFYIAAYKHGAWSPADVPYDDLLNTRFPWLFVLFGGFFPAVSEEFLFRMFAIPFLRKLTRSLAAGVVLAAFIWGFGHSAYPQQPFWVRGVEVGIGGIVLGLIMLRWGILPTLAWHYSVDAVYSAMLLMRSHSLYFKLSGAASAGIVLAPVIVALAAYWIRGGFEPETGLLNSDERAPEPEPETAPEPAPRSLDYQPLSRKWKLAAWAIGAAGLLSLLIPIARFADRPKYRLTEPEARSAAGAFLNARGFPAASFQSVTYPAAHWGGLDSQTAKYFLEHGGVPRTSEMLQRYRPPRYWGVRYFRPLEQDEALVSIQPETGRALGFERRIPEDRPGPDLAPDAAEKIASAFAAANGWNLANTDLKENGSEKKKSRRDYSLIWEARPGDPRNVAEARYRVEVGISGDQVTRAGAYWKLPETWVRQRERQNAISIGALTLRTGALAGLAVLAIWVLVLNIRKGAVHWRPVIWLGVAGALLTAIAATLSFPLLLREYPTAIPLGTFRAATFVSAGISVVAAFLIMGAAAALITSLFPGSLPSLRTANRRALAADALASLAAAAGLLFSLGQARAALSMVFPAQALFSLGDANLIASAAPALAALANAARSILMGAAVVAVLAAAVRLIPKRWMLAPLIVLAVFALISGDVRTPGELAVQCLLALLGVGCFGLFCLGFARSNYLAYLLALCLLALRTPAAELFGTEIPLLHVQAWGIVIAMAALVVWAVYPALAGQISRRELSGRA